MMQSVITYPPATNGLQKASEIGEIMQEHLLTVPEVAEWLQMDEATVRKKARNGTLPAKKIGREYRFRKADLDEWYNKLNNGTRPRQQNSGVPIGSFGSDSQASADSS